jgi:hypothetical protein
MLKYEIPKYPSSGKNYFIRTDRQTDIMKSELLFAVLQSTLTQDRQCGYTVTIRCFRATIVAVDKQ